MNVRVCVSVCGGYEPTIHVSCASVMTGDGPMNANETKHRPPSVAWPLRPPHLGRLLQCRSSPLSYRRLVVARSVGPSGMPIYMRERRGTDTASAGALLL